MITALISSSEYNIRNYQLLIIIVIIHYIIFWIFIFNIMIKSAEFVLHVYLILNIDLALYIFIIIMDTILMVNKILDVVWIVHLVMILDDDVWLVVVILIVTDNIIGSIIVIVGWGAWTAWLYILMNIFFIIAIWIAIIVWRSRNNPWGIILIYIGLSTILNKSRRIIIVDYKACLLLYFKLLACDCIKLLFSSLIYRSAHK